MGTKELDGRLGCIARMVPPGQLAVDVGSDHGLLIAHLVETGRVAGGFATDINPGPLSRTQQLLQLRGLEHKVEARLTDGLQGVPPENIDTIVIAGMGGELIFSIITAWPHHKNPDITWLLQPMTKAPKLRRQLWQAGFSLDEERCCRAAGRDYTVFRVHWAGAPQDFLPWQPYVGQLQSRSASDHQALTRYCEHLLTVAAAREAAGGSAENIRALRDAAAHIMELISD